MTLPTRIGVLSAGEIIGDGLNKLPFLRALRNRWPAAHITWMTTRDKTVYARDIEVLAAPYLDEIMEGVYETPNNKHYHILIDTQTKIKEALRARHRLSHDVFVTAAGRYWLSDRRPKPRPMSKHLVERLLNLIVLAGGKPADSSGEVVLPEKLEQLAKRLLPPSKSYIGLAPGAGDKKKCWSLERYIEVAKFCVQEGHCPVFLIGPAEQHWKKRLKKDVPSALFPEEEAPKSNRGPLLVMALARQLQAAVSNDSGTSHMLAAVNTTLVTLFGPSNAKKFLKKSPKNMNLIAESGNVEDISVDRVIEVLRDI